MEKNESDPPKIPLELTASKTEHHEFRCGYCTHTITEGQHFAFIQIRATPLPLHSSCVYEYQQQLEATPDAQRKRQEHFEKAQAIMNAVPQEDAYSLVRIAKLTLAALTPFSSAPRQDHLADKAKEVFEHTFKKYALAGTLTTRISEIFQVFSGTTAALILLGLDRVEESGKVEKLALFSASYFVAALTKTIGNYRFRKSYAQEVKNAYTPLENQIRLLYAPETSTLEDRCSEETTTREPNTRAKTRL